MEFYLQSMALYFWRHSSTLVRTWMKSSAPAALSASMLSVGLPATMKMKPAALAALAASTPKVAYYSSELHTTTISAFTA